MADSLPNRKYRLGVESSLDLDMVSAICPRCNILLVEAQSSYPSMTLGAAENTAVSLGAPVGPNSFGTTSTNVEHHR